MTAPQISNKFGIEFVEDKDVPDAPRKNSRNDALWLGVKEMLPLYPGTFAKVKQFESATGAAQKASAINGNKNKAFPAGAWEARYTSDAEAGTSILFMAYKVDADESVEADSDAEENEDEAAEEEVA